MVVTASALVVWETSVLSDYATASWRDAGNSEVQKYEDSRWKAMAATVCEEDQFAARAPVRLYLGSDPPLSCAARTCMRY